MSIIEDLARDQILRFARAKERMVREHLGLPLDGALSFSDDELRDLAGIVDDLLFAEPSVFSLIDDIERWRDKVLEGMPDYLCIGMLETGPYCKALLLARKEQSGEQDETGT